MSQVLAGLYALLSVADKSGIVDFSNGLLALGIRLIASGGTAEVLSKAGLPVLDVAKLVGGKAILGHRVVTLSREVHAGLLATDSFEDVAELEKLGVPRISLVCVDMYALEAEIAREGATLESVIGKNDIGGPTMLRSGVKGRRIVICDPADREKVLRFLQRGITDEEIGELAAKAEFTVAGYVLASARYLGNGQFEGVLAVRARKLCYGENRRQKNAALFMSKSAQTDPLALDKFHLLEGNDPSFVNMTDVHRLVETATRIGAGFECNFGSVPFIAVAVKHGNACGAAVGDNMYEVIRKMVSGDPESLSGGIVLVNFNLDTPAAVSLRSYLMGEGQKRVLDSVIAPGFTDRAVDELVRRTGKCRLFINPALEGRGLGLKSLDTTRRFRQVRGGFLAQDGDSFVLKCPDKWEPALTISQEADVVLSWAIGSTSNSNTIVLVSGGKLIGAGVNQRSRVMACKIALLYAQTYGHSTTDAVAYSDSFFPFPDGPETLADAGINVIFATSGSINDGETAEVCRKRGVTLLQLPDAEARGFYGH